MNRKILYLFILLLFVNIVQGATIRGSVYSFDLEERNNTIISVNSEPLQTIVSKDGTYSFDLDLGSYVIGASYYDEGGLKETTKESIEIKKQGTFILDLILFPYLGDEEELLEDIDENIDDSYFEAKINYFDIVIVVVIFAIVIFIIYFTIKNKKSMKEVKQKVEETSEKIEKVNVSDLADDILEFIKKEGNRVTQKDIRNEFPLSEAKISLVISELESKKIVKRIKKGRGNIIVLN